jgi:hypothetical protein
MPATGKAIAQLGGMFMVGKHDTSGPHV